MDSRGFFFGQFAVSARVGSGDGVDLAASGSCASVSERWGLLHSACDYFGGIARHGIPGKPPGCGVVAFLAQAVTVLRHPHLTVHSSRTGFASRLNSGVRW
jgi:hypothetical protein